MKKSIMFQDLLAEIYAYQNTMDDVRSKGQGQIGRYMTANPDTKSVIEKQLGNVQSSYEALLNTALQIKQRLNDSLIKFQEYEAIIDSILQNLIEWEPSIAEQLDTGVISIEDCKQQLENIKVIL